MPSALNTTFKRRLDPRFAEMPAAPLAAIAPMPAPTPALPPVHGSCRWAFKLGPVDGIEASGLLEITIGGVTTLYGVHRLFDGARLVGYRLHKWASEDVTMNDIDVTVDPWHCSCADFLFRREYRDREGCKHVRALRAALAAIGQLPGMPANGPGAAPH